VIVIVDLETLSSYGCFSKYCNSIRASSSTKCVVIDILFCFFDRFSIEKILLINFMN
jgi:hypothetical protein